MKPADSAFMLTIQEVASILKKSIRTLYNWHAQGYGPVPVKSDRGVLLYLPADVHAHLVKEVSEVKTRVRASKPKKRGPKPKTPRALAREDAARLYMRTRRARLLSEGER